MLAYLGPCWDFKNFKGFKLNILWKCPALKPNQKMLMWEQAKVNCIIFCLLSNIELTQVFKENWRCQMSFCQHHLGHKLRQNLDKWKNWISLCATFLWYSGRFKMQPLRSKIFLWASNMKKILFWDGVLDGKKIWNISFKRQHCEVVGKVLIRRKITILICNRNIRIF